MDVKHQKYIAEICGVSESFVSQVLHGKKKNGDVKALLELAGYTVKNKLTQKDKLKKLEEENKKMLEALINIKNYDGHKYSSSTDELNEAIFVIIEIAEDAIDELENKNEQST